VEIKTAYRTLALSLHPDRHDGCDQKTKAFKDASEAYSILTNNNRRREYDMATGWATPSGCYNKNRRRPPTANYRKVYAPHAPPDGKWHDAQRHYDMHYGDGMFREAMNSVYEQAKLRGDFDYFSPLGKGFAFETREDRKSRYSQDSYGKNPYSREVQGPPTIQFTYQEGYLNEAGEAKTVLKRKEGVIDKLHERRKERYDKQKQDAPTPIIPGQKIYEPLNQPSGSSEGCTIM
jgi:molecular chaperone DnaJ